MKKVLKIVLCIFLVIYIAIVGFLTTCLLKYNDYNITELGDKSLIIIEDDELKPTYKKGDLVVVSKSKATDIKEGEYIFFYNTYANQVSVNYTKVINAETIEVGLNQTETTFTLEGDYPLSEKYVIGKQTTSKTYSGLGSVLKILESRWGYLLFVIVPILFAFVYEIYVVIKEVRSTSKKTAKKVESDKEKE